MLTCPCHAIPLVILLSSTGLGAFLFLHLVSMMMVMGSLFLLSIWLLWQTRDSRQQRSECKSCREGTGES
jgi:high-affinity Fe2+/Pb2+ permease